MTKTADWTAAAAATDRALPPGSRIDDYEIEQTLAEDGVAIVYRVFDHALGLQLALEEYMPEALALRSTDGRVVLRTRVQGHAFEEGRQAFIGEAQTLARCEHPALLRVDRVLQRNGTVYRAMRLCAGPTLLAHRRGLDERPDAATLQRWLEDLLGALGALHAEGRMHGALAPGRILLRDDGHLLLLGFDAVRAKLISGRTQDMMAALEPGFAAPESRNPSPGQTTGPWTDLYALATTLRFCIDGELPAPASTTAQPIRLLSEAWRRAPHEAASDAAWLRAVDACLADAPQDRPQSIDDLRRRIDEARFASTLLAWPAPRIAPAPPNDAGADASVEIDAGAQPPAAPAQPEPSALPEPAPTVAADAPARHESPVIGAPSAAQADIADMMADLEQAIVRVSAIAGEEAQAQQVAAEMQAASGIAPAAPAAAKLEPASPRAWTPAQTPAPPQRELRGLWQRHPAVWLAAAVVIAVAVVLLLMRGERPSVELAASDVPAAAPMAEPAGGRTTIPSGEPAVVPPSTAQAMPAPLAPAATATPVNLAPGKSTPAPAPSAVEPAAAQPAAKPATTARPHPAPRAACTGKSGYALYQCMQTTCSKRAYAKHPQCVRLLRNQSLN